MVPKWLNRWLNSRWHPIVMYFCLALLSASFNLLEGVHRADVIGAPLFGLGENGWKILEAERYCSAAALLLAGCSHLWGWKKELPLCVLGLLLAASSQETNKNWHRDPDFGGMLIVSKLMFWIGNALAMLLLIVFLFTLRRSIWSLQEIAKRE